MAKSRSTEIDRLITACGDGRGPQEIGRYPRDIVEDALWLISDVTPTLAIYAVRRGSYRRLLRRTDLSDAVYNGVWDEMLKPPPRATEPWILRALELNNLLEGAAWRRVLAPRIAHELAELRSGSRRFGRERRWESIHRAAAALYCMSDDDEPLELRLMVLRDLRAYFHFPEIFFGLPEALLRAAFRDAPPSDDLAVHLLERPFVMEDPAWCDQLIPTLPEHRRASLPAKIMKRLPAPLNGVRATDVLIKHVWPSQEATILFASELSWSAPTLLPLLTQEDIFRCLASAPPNASVRELLMRLLCQLPAEATFSAQEPPPLRAPEEEAVGMDNANARLHGHSRRRTA